MATESQTKYHRKMSIVATQIDLLNHYDPQGRAERMTESFGVINPGMHASKPAHDKIDVLMENYDLELFLYVAEKNPTKDNPEVRKKLKELDTLALTL